MCAAFAALLSAGCAAPNRVAGPVITRDTGLAKLGAAITSFDQTRAAVLRATADVIAGAIALDAADDACATGSIQGSVSARAKARAAIPRTRAALSALPVRLSAYGSALTALAADEKAATSLSTGQRAALDAVVVGGRAENSAADAFRVAGQAAWPSYLNLDAAQSTWLDQRLAGWYRDAPEAAGAYAVLVRDGRPALERARTLLQRVDAARRPISERERVAVAAADNALTSV
ncbi:MAG: hypothetical protein NVS3B26_10360 [Mycobacteriales bacterium]